MHWRGLRETTLLSSVIAQKKIRLGLDCLVGPRKQFQEMQELRLGLWRVGVESISPCLRLGGLTISTRLSVTSGFSSFEKKLITDFSLSAGLVLVVLL